MAENNFFKMTDKQRQEKGNNTKVNPKNKKQPKKTSGYKAGDVVNIGDRQYELNDDIASMMNRAAIDESFLNSEHAKTLKPVDGKTTAVGQIFSGNDPDQKKAEAIDAANRFKATAARQGQKVYDKGTMTPSSMVDDNGQAIKNVQTQANAVQKRYEDNPYMKTMTEEQAETIATNAAKNSTPLTEEEATERVNDIVNPKEPEKTAVDLYKQPEVKATLDNLGVSDEPTETDYQNAQAQFKDETGYEYNDLAKAGRDALELGFWDTFAKIATAVSLVGFMATGGQIMPINFMALTGTQEKEKALRDIGSKAADTDLLTDKRKTIQADKESFINEYRKANPNATDAEIEAEYEKQMKAAGQAEYDVSGTSAQDTANLERDLKRMDKELRNNIMARTADSKAKIDEIKAEAAEGRLSEEKRTALQKELTKQLQDLQNASEVEKYAYFKNSPFAKDFSDYNDFQRQLQGGELTTGEYIKGYFDTVLSSAATAAGGIAKAKMGK